MFRSINIEADHMSKLIVLRSISVKVVAWYNIEVGRMDAH